MRVDYDKSSIGSKATLADWGASERRIQSGRHINTYIHTYIHTCIRTLIFDGAHFDVVGYVWYMTAFHGHACFLYLRMHPEGR